jgi:hypothetical protein
MTISTGEWAMDQDKKCVMAHASESEIKEIRLFSIKAMRALENYNEAAAFKLRQDFWQDARADGLTFAMEKWSWLIKGI